MTRQLSIDMQHDVPHAFAGDLWTYVPVPKFGYYGLGVAVANQAGYSPINAYHYSVDTYDEAAAEAVRLNKERGQTLDQSTDIILSSMAAGKVAS